MTAETVTRVQRIYLRLENAGSGMMRIGASLLPPPIDEPALVLLSRGIMPMGQPISMALVSDPTQNPALRGKDATTLLGTVTLTEAAKLAIAAGTRRLTVETPAKWGVKVGDDLIVVPVAVPIGFATHDVTVTGPNMISIGLTAPIVAAGTSYTIQCRVRRFN